MISENIVKTEIINCPSCEKTYNDDFQEYNYVFCKKYDKRCLDVNDCVLKNGINELEKNKTLNIIHFLCDMKWRQVTTKNNEFIKIK